MGAIADALSSATNSDIISIGVITYLILNILKNWSGTPLEKSVAEVIGTLKNEMKRMSKSHDQLVKSVQETNQQMLRYVMKDAEDSE